MSDDSSDDGMDDVVDAEIIGDGPGTELDVWDPDQAGDAEPGTELDPYTWGVDQAGPTVTVLGVDDLDDEIDAELDALGGSDGSPRVTSDSGPASRGGGGGGLGGGKLSRKERKRRGLGGGGGGGGFTLFGFTLNVSPRLNIASGNTASVFGGRAGRAQRTAQAARLTRGGRNGSPAAMRRRITRARWLDKALGGGR